MSIFKLLWTKVSQTQALRQSCGKLEKAFFGSTYRVMYVVGISFSEERFPYLIYSRVVKTVLGLFVCSELWHLFNESKSLDDVISNINVTFIHLIALYRYINMVINQSLYQKLAKSMDLSSFNLSSSKRKRLVEFWVLRNEGCLKLLLALGCCTISIWYIYPLIDDVEYNLVVALWLPFDYRNLTYYPLTYLLVLIPFNYIAFFVMVNDLIMQSHLMHILCQYTILSECFENILADCNPRKGFQRNKFIYGNLFKEVYLNRLDFLVDQHNLILNNTMKLRDSLSMPMLGQLAASGMLICFAGYQVSSALKINVVKFLMSLLYLGYNLFELFIFCRWCDEIKIQSENISNAVYCSGWESGIAADPAVRSRLMIIAARARRPLVLTAGGFTDVSLATYTSLIHTSYSALTVLLRLGQD